MTDTRSILVTKPVLTKRTRGGWMAISEAGSVLRVAVVGDTEEQAIERFDELIKGWCATRQPSHSVISGTSEPSPPSGRSLTAPPV
jgi:hypothetical protein